MKETTKAIVNQLEAKMGVKITRARIGVGSMRDYIYIRFARPIKSVGHEQDRAAIKQWLIARLGFAPFFTQPELNNEIGANLELRLISKP